MTDSNILVPSSGPTKVDTDSLTVGADTVHRQRFQLAGALATEIVRILSSSPAGTEFGLVVRNIPSGTQAISASTLPLPDGAATESTLLTLTKPSDQQHAIIDSSALPTGAATEATLATRLTNSELRASPIPVSGTVATGGLTDTELRATPVAISGTVTATTGGLTDTQLRASAVPVSLATAPTTPVTGTFFQETQPISVAALPLPADAATQTTLALIKAKTDNLDVALSTRAVTGLTDTQLRASAIPVSGSFFQATQPVSAVSLPLPLGAATEVTLAARFAAVPVPSSPSFLMVSALGDNLLYTPASGKRIRLKWFGLATSQNNSAEVVAILKIGTTQLRGWPLGNPGAFANGFVHEGAVDETMKLNLSVAGQPVYANWSLEEF